MRWCDSNAKVLLRERFSLIEGDLNLIEIALNLVFVDLLRVTLRDVEIEKRNTLERRLTVDVTPDQCLDEDFLGRFEVGNFDLNFPDVDLDGVIQCGEGAHIPVVALTECLGLLLFRGELARKS